MSLYDDAMNSKPQFKTNAEALEHYIREYEAITMKYGKTRDAFWLEAENAEDSTEWNDDYDKILSLSRKIGMCRYLIKKEKENG